ALNNNGANLAVDGVFGPLTDSAVKDYQRSNGLLVDGVVGPETRGSLNGTSSAPSGGTSAPASSSNSGNAIVDAARSAIGTPYSYGGSSMSGMDCSGLINYAYQAAGIDVPRTSSQIANGGRSISQSQAQPRDVITCPGLIRCANRAAGIDGPRASSQIASGGRSISQSQAQPGDIVTWPGHVAIYAGNGKISDASGSKQTAVERGIWGSPGFVTYR